MLPADRFSFCLTFKLIGRQQKHQTVIFIRVSVVFANVIAFIRIINEVQAVKLLSAAIASISAEPSNRPKF